MRLYNIYYLCKKNIKVIEELSFTEKTKQTQHTYIINNWPTVTETLLKLRKVSLLQPSIDEFFEVIPVYQYGKTVVEISRDVYAQLKAKKSKLENKMQTIIELYESMGLQETSVSIDVNIPMTDSTGDYISILKDLDFIFSHYPYIQHSDGQIKLLQTDVGSQWLIFEIALKSAATASVATYILKCIAALIDTAIQVRSHYESLKQQQLMTEKLQMDSDMRKQAITIFEQLKDAYLEDAMKQIQEQNSDCPLSDGEERGKVKTSIEKMITLMERDVHIYASITAPEEVQVLFPESQEVPVLPTELIKLVEDKSNS